MLLSAESLTNYVAVRCVEIGQPCAKASKEDQQCDAMPLCCSQLAYTPRSMSGRAARTLGTAAFGSELPHWSLMMVNGSARWRPPTSQPRMPWRHHLSGSSCEVSDAVCDVLVWCLRVDWISAFISHLSTHLFVYVDQVLITIFWLKKKEVDSIPWRCSGTARYTGNEQVYLFT